MVAPPGSECERTIALYSRKPLAVGRALNSILQDRFFMKYGTTEVANFVKWISSAYMVIGLVRRTIVPQARILEIIKYCSGIV